MKKKEKKGKKGAWMQYVMMLAFFAIGGICGVFLGRYMAEMEEAGKNMQEILLHGAVLVLGLYVAMFAHIALHEAGHLVFGLLTGYSFSSYRVGSLMVVKEQGRLRLRRYSLAGTGGQCLMTPPELVDGKVPYVLYNLGGSIMNFAVSLICVGLYFLLRDVPMLSVFFIIMAVVGIGFGAMNGIPMRMGTVDNDGYNALSLGKDPAALRSFWVQLSGNALTAQGIRTKDMPREWFEVPSEEEMKNSITAVLGVLASGRLMDEHDFVGAGELMARLMGMDKAIAGIYKNMMVCDMAYCEMVGENRADKLAPLLTKEQKRFMKSMKTSPTVLRTEYTYALLQEKDAAKAERIMEKFEKVAKKYPYPGDIQSERELMEIAWGKSGTAGEPVEAME